VTATDVPLIPVPAAPAADGYRHITVAKHAGSCGAVVSGVDLATDLDDDVVAEIRRALLDHQVIFFREQSLTPEQQVAFSRRFGPYSPVPFVEPIAEHPEVIAVVREPSEQAGLVFGGLWHSDFSFLPAPPMGSILHAIEVPPYGADTLWANQYLAHRALSKSMRSLVAPLRGVHSAVNAYSPKMQAIHDMFAGMTVQTSDEANRTQDHPVVRIHAETGKPALFVNAQYTVALAGFHPHESRLLLDHLVRIATDHGYTCRWHWEPGDVAFWDNRCVQHMVMADVVGHRRYMHRTTVAGEAPIAADAT
jgi:taurine dioxygenase